MLAYKRKHEQAGYYCLSCPTCKASIGRGEDLICVSCKRGGSCPVKECDGQRISNKNISFFICNDCIKDNEWMEILAAGER